MPLSRRAGTPSNTIWPGLRSTSVPSGVFIHPVIWLQRTLDKIRGCAPLGEAKPGPHLTHSCLAEAYLHTKWHLDTSSRLSTIKMSRKRGALPPSGRRGAGSPSSTMWPGPRPTSMPSAIYIDPSSRLPTIDMGQKLGRGLRPIFGRGLCPDLTQSSLG